MTTHKKNPHSTPESTWDSTRDSSEAGVVAAARGRLPRDLVLRALI